jgi:hypothetical protein
LNLTSEATKNGWVFRSVGSVGQVPLLNLTSEAMANRRVSLKVKGRLPRSLRSLAVTVGGVLNLTSEATKNGWVFRSVESVGQVPLLNLTSGAMANRRVSLKVKGRLPRSLRSLAVTVGGVLNLTSGATKNGWVFRSVGSVGQVPLLNLTSGAMANRRVSLKVKGRLPRSLRSLAVTVGGVLNLTSEAGANGRPL